MLDLLHRKSKIENQKSTLGWAIFLGVSWTWCIGMFLPVLLVREYGVWGWIVFAIPNVIGAAAMGWVLRDADASRRIVEAHAPACSAFSIVTIAFHIFFIGWLNTLFAGFAPLALVVAAAIYLFGMTRSAADTLMALVVLIVSLTCAGLYGRFDVRLEQLHDFNPALLGLIPVSIFGFLFCPYLDLTFHRARQATSPAGGRIAFTIGFGICFFLMIIFTLIYARDPSFNELFRGFGMRAPKIFWPTVIAIHMIVQIGFTLAVHARSLVERARTDGNLSLRWNTAAFLIAALLGYLTATDLRYRALAALHTGELIYRCFMGFYGLVFPAYVWICMIPFSTSRRPDRRSLVVFASAVTLASPFFALGFIGQRMFWLIPGLLIVLAAKILARPQAASVA
jgi:uncharacterized membrane protein YiaA